jgi:hypothetical protein
MRQCGQCRQAAGESEFAGRVQFLQSGPEFPSKHAAKDPHRHEETGTRCNPKAVQVSQASACEADGELADAGQRFFQKLTASRSSEHAGDFSS